MPLEDVAEPIIGRFGGRLRPGSEKMLGVSLFACCDLLYTRLYQFDRYLSGALLFILGSDE